LQSNIEAGLDRSNSTTSRTYSRSGTTPWIGEAAATEGRDVTLVLSEGQVNLGDTIDDSSEEIFESPDDRQNEVMSRLPRHAVGDPYQSEREG